MLIVIGRIIDGIGCYYIGIYDCVITGAVSAFLILWTVTIDDYYYAVTKWIMQER